MPSDSLDISAPKWPLDAGSCALGVVGAVLGWTTLYFCLCLSNSRRSLEWHCRLVTTLHAITMVLLSAWCGFVQGPWPFTHPGGPNTPLQHLTCILCLGYFIFDLSWCLYHRTEGMVMLIHHCVSILGNSIVVLGGSMGTEMIATLFGTELSNPLLQLRWFLRSTGHHHTWYAELADIAFIVVFTVMRIGLASSFLYAYWRHPTTNVIGKFGGVCIYVIGWVFWLMVVRYAVRKYSKMYRAWNSPKLSEKNGRTTNGHAAGEKNGFIGKKED